MGRMKLFSAFLCSLAAIAVMAGPVRADDLGCEDIPSGLTATCGEIIVNARLALQQLSKKTDNGMVAQKKACRGKKNAKLRKGKGFSARDIKKSKCAKAMNGSTGNEVLKSLLEGALSQAEFQCGGCSI